MTHTSLRERCDELRGRVSLSSVAGSSLKLRRAAREWKACCPFHPDRTPSFTIYADDKRFMCFGCGAEGDVLDFVMRAYTVRLSEAIGMLARGALAELPQQRAPAKPKPDTRAAAARIVADSAPIDGTPADTYLRARGISMSLPNSLRFARLAPPRNSGVLEANGPGLLPALVAVVTDPSGTLIGIQRTYLGEDGGKAASSDRKVKFSLGMVAGGAIQLGPADRSIIVTEGLEDGLTLAQALGRSVWVAAGTSMMPRMAFSAVTRAVVIGADGDEAGERAATKAAEAFAGGQLAVRIMRPSSGYKDFNEELMEARS